MRHIIRSMVMIFMLSMILTSCDGNVFVRPDVSAEIEETRSELGTHLEKKCEIEIGDKKLSSLYVVVYRTLSDLNAKLPEPLTDDEVERLARYIIPENNDIDLYFSIDTIPPFISADMMATLLYVEAPQDIARINELLSQKIEGNARDAVQLLYDAILLKFFKPDEDNGSSGIFAFKNILHITDDYTTLTNGDYISVQLILSFLLDTIPEAVFDSYVLFEPNADNPDPKINQYLSELGDNMIKALLVNKKPLIHIVSTYTFLNKYNASTTIIDMRNLGSFFSVEEEV